MNSEFLNHDVRGYTFMSHAAQSGIKNFWRASKFDQTFDEHQQVHCNEYVVAIISKIDVICSPKDATEFSGEVAMIQSIHHPQIAKIHDFFDDDKYFYAAFETPKSSSLSQIGKLEDLKQIKNFLISMTNIINYLKSSVHIEDCFFTPETIFVNDDGSIETVFISHLNSKMFSRSKSVEVFLSPPEKLASMPLGDSSKYQTAESFIWLCGNIFYFALFGEYPFYSKSLKQASHNVLSNHLFLTDKTDEKYQSLLMGTLTKNPSMRLSIEATLQILFSMVNNKLKKAASLTSKKFRNLPNFPKKLTSSNISIIMRNETNEKSEKKPTLECRPVSANNYPRVRIQTKRTFVPLSKKLVCIK